MGRLIQSILAAGVAGGCQLGASDVPGRPDATPTVVAPRVGEAPRVLDADHEALIVANVSADPDYRAILDFAVALGCNLGAITVAGAQDGVLAWTAGVCEGGDVVEVTASTDVDGNAIVAEGRLIGQGHDGDTTVDRIVVNEYGDAEIVGERQAIEDGRIEAALNWSAWVRCTACKTLVGKLLGWGVQTACTWSTSGVCAAIGWVTAGIGGITCEGVVLGTCALGGKVVGSWGAAKTCSYFKHCM